MSPSGRRSRRRSATSPTTCSSARAQGATFRTIGIKIRFEGFQTHLRERTLGSHVLDEKVLTDVAQDLAKEFAGRKRRVRLLGVRVTHLERPKTKQPQLTAFE